MVNKEKFIERALKQIQKGNLDKALAEYQSASATDPKDVSIKLRIGDLYVKTNRVAEAIKEYSDVARSNSQQGFYLKSIAVYKQVLKLDESNLDVHYRLAELYTKQRLIADAIGEYSVIVATFDKKGKSNEALELLKKMVEIDTENVGVRLKLAENLQRQGFEADAISEYSTILEKLLAKNKLERAETIYVDLYNAYPGKVSVLEGLAEIFKRKGDDMQYLRFAGALKSAYVEAGDMVRAAEVAEAILEKNPEDADARLLLGRGAEADATEPLVTENELPDPDDFSQTQSIVDASVPDVPQSVQTEVEAEAVQGEPEGEAVVALPFETGVEPEFEEEVEFDIGGAEAGEETFVEPVEEVAEVAEVVDEPQEVVDEAGADEELEVEFEIPAEAVFETDAEAEAEELEVEVPVVDDAELEAVEPVVDEVASEPVEPVETEEAAVEEAAAPVEDAQPPEVDVEFEIPDEAVFETDAEPETVELEVEVPVVDDAEAEAEELEVVEPVVDDAELEAVEPVVDEVASEPVEPVETEEAAVEEPAAPVEDAQPPEVDVEFEIPDEAVFETEVEELEVVEPVIDDAEPEVEELEVVEPVVDDAELEAEELEVEVPVVDDAELEAVEPVVDEVASEPVEPVETEEAVVEDAAAPAEDAQPPEVDVEFEVPAEAVSETDAEPETVELEVEVPVVDDAELEAEELEVEVPVVDDAELEAVEPIVDEVSPEAVEPKVAVVDEAAPEEEAAPDADVEPVFEWELEEPEVDEADSGLNGLEEPEALSGLEPEAVDAEDDLAEQAISEAIDELMDKIEPGPSADEVLGTSVEKVLDDTVDEGAQEYVDLSEELGMRTEPAGGGASEVRATVRASETTDEFRTGLEDQLRREDTETHYNLGIAYMEMELFKEAAKEFKVALKDPNLQLDCYSRLGMLSMAEVNPQEAILYFQKALKIEEGWSEDERKGCMYELALAYEAANDRGEAAALFSEINEIDSGYREVAVKVKEYGGAVSVSIPMDDDLIEVELL